MSKKNKQRDGIVYSTNNEYTYNEEENEEVETLDPSEQNLKVLIDRKGRAGKTATVITGFVGQEEDLQALGKMIKSKCATGGSVKEGEIIIQGDFRERIMVMLEKAGYRAKKSGG